MKQQQQTTSQILEAIEKYYNELYASVNYPQENDVDEFTEYLKIPKLTDADRDKIEVHYLMKNAK